MISDDDIESREYDTDQLDEMGDILRKAKLIQDNSEIFKAVLDHMKGKAKQIKSIDDLKTRAKDLEATSDNVRGTNN